MAKVKRQLIIQPGHEALQGFMSKKGKLFNLTEMERMCKLSGGKLRHISAGSRQIERATYIAVQDNVLPILCELVFILQRYQYDETFQVSEDY